VDLQAINKKYIIYAKIYEDFSNIIEDSVDPYVKFRLESILLRLSKMHSQTKEVSTENVFTTRS